MTRELKASALHSVWKVEPIPQLFFTVLVVNDQKQMNVISRPIINMYLKQQHKANFQSIQTYIFIMMLSVFKNNVTRSENGVDLFLTVSFTLHHSFFFPFFVLVLLVFVFFFKCVFFQFKFT